jgi:hypothetical protein
MCAGVLQGIKCRRRYESKKDEKKRKARRPDAASAAGKHLGASSRFPSF